MRAPLFPFACVLLVGLLFGCTPEKPPPSALSGAPAIIIRQYPDYPMPGRDSDFPGGLVAALWPDGRIVRPTDIHVVGKSYVEGVVSVGERKAFFTFLSTSAAVRIPEGGDIPLHAATESITVRLDGKTSRWTRLLPDTQSAWREVEARLMSLPLQDSHRVTWQAIRSASWYE
jgi:hypothetical protein